MPDWFLIPALWSSIVDFNAVVSKWHSNFWWAEMVLQIFTRTQLTQESDQYFLKHATGLP
jgi:hypothetical protein